MRRKIANWLIALARRIDPPNPDYIQFILDRCTESIIHGQSVIKISAPGLEDVYETVKGYEPRGPHDFPV